MCVVECGAACMSSSYVTLIMLINCVWGASGMYVYKWYILCVHEESTWCYCCSLRVVADSLKVTLAEMGYYNIIIIAC